MSGDLTCRPITPDDLEPDFLDEATALEEAAFGEGGLNRWTLPPYVRYGRVYGAFLAGTRLIGLAECMRSWSYPEEAYLAGFSIAPSCRHRGFGTSLMGFMAADMRESGVGLLFLTLSPSNVTAASFYEYNGFTATKELPLEYGEAEGRLLLVRTLL